MIRLAKGAASVQSESVKLVNELVKRYSTPLSLDSSSRRPRCKPTPELEAECKVELVGDPGKRNGASSSLLRL